MLYITCIMTFVWRTSVQDTNPPGDLSKGGLLVVRIVITVVLGLGMLYGWLILNTFSRYGEAMDKAWKKRIDGWLDEKASTQFIPQSITSYIPCIDPSSQTQPQSSQYPGYSETVRDYQSSAPAYTSQPYGSYPSDSKVGYTGPDFGPYANADYVPPDPYDSSSQSRPESPQITSSTLFATRANTQYNKTSSLQRGDSISTPIYNGPGYTTQHPLPAPPPPAKAAPYNNIPPPRLVLQKTPFAVPPGPNLPLIPRTPMTAFTNRSSENASLREGEALDNDNNAAGLTTGRRSKQVADDETHVRFRSPLISAEGSFSFASSDKEADESLLLGAEASGLSLTARVSPISSEYGDLGRESEPLRQRELG